jgi:hypothetical protein
MCFVGSVHPYFKVYTCVIKTCRDERCWYRITIGFQYWYYKIYYVVPRRCTNTNPGVGWLSRGYDDSSWSRANTIAKNDGSKWRVIRGMSRRAQWIWTSNEQQDTTVYCRTEKGLGGDVNFANCVMPHKQLIKDIILKTYIIY